MGRKRDLFGGEEDTDRDSWTDDVPPLTPREIKDFRALLEHEKRVVWFWASIRVWALWLTALATATTIGWDVIKKIILLATGSGGK